MTQPQHEEHRQGGVGRIAAGFAVLLAAVVVGALLLAGEDYRVSARFEAATALVKGNLVQSGGRKVGTVQDIRLTDNGQAELELQITDEDLVPLPEGTEAHLRLASLSGQANRFVDLRMPERRAGDEGPSIPDGGVIPSARTATAVDVDTFFSLFDEDTRDGLRKVIRGNAKLYEGSAQAANDGFESLNPSLVASRRLFGELNRDSALLERFVVSSSKLVTDLADRDESLAQLVDRLATATGAIAREESSLTRAVATLPPFMRRANTTFVNLRAALRDLGPLVEESKPVARKLRPFLAELRPAARGARPTLRDLSALIRRPGQDDDLIDLTRSAVPLRDIAVGPVRRNGAEREGALPASTKALAVAAPELATARPYAPDLTNWFDDFSHSGLYDAMGGGSRAAPNVNLFAAVDGLLQPIPAELRAEFFKFGASLNQNYRCPGAAERGAAWKPTPDFPCDETQVPLGR